MASPISSLLGAPADNPTPNSSAPGAVPDKQMFLKLLVSQIQNQDPLNPTDSTQFVGQLAQFSELEQLIAMRGDMDKVAAAAPSASNPTATDPGSGTTSSTPGTNTNSTGPAASSTNSSANTQS